MLKCCYSGKKYLSKLKQHGLPHILSEEFLFKFFVFTCIYLNVISPHGTEHPPWYSRYPPHLSWYPPRYWTPHGTQDIPHGTHDIPHGTHDIPHGTEHPPMVLHTHYTGWFCEGMFRLEESQMFSFEIHTGWKFYKSFEIYTGWKSYKIQGDCQVFSIFKKLFIFRGGYLQYRGGCSVPWGIFSTMGDIMMHMGGYHEYRGGCSAWYWTPPTVLLTHYTGWKSYKIQGDCQVFSIFKSFSFS